MFYLILLAILVASFIVRVVNLNYNSPSNDEAIYVVLGRLGIFQFDWSSYNTSSWVAGNIYIYPTLTAISYSILGIAGSRLLNVLFGVLSVGAIFSITTLLSPLSGSYKLISGLIAAALVGGAATALYVGRLATYDMPSFYFLLLSIQFLLFAQQSKYNLGKWYFLSAVFLLLSFATKIITGIYLPIILTFSFWQARNCREQLFFWKRYFLYIFFVGASIYAFISLRGNIVYLTGQASREVADWLNIVRVIWESSSYIWIFAAIGSLGLLINKEWQKLLILMSGAILIILFHLASHRLSTLDKHVFLTVSFLSIISGLGIGHLIFKSPQILKKAGAAILIISLITFWVLSYSDSQKFNSQWENSTSIMGFLSKTVGSGDIVLAELGPPAILSVYEKNHPTNVSTFDWLQYRKFTGNEAYANAVKDGYFNLIELEDENKSKNFTYQKVHQVVKENLSDNYRLIYSQNGYQVFKRNY